MRVLIVDDSPDFRALATHLIAAEWPRAMVEALDPEGRAAPGAEFPWASFDVVLLDYRLGAQDGLEWLRGWRELSGVPPVIFMTAGGSEDVAVRAMKLGAADYIRKDALSRQRLAEAIREATAGSGTGPSSRDAPAPREGHMGGYRVIRQLGEGAQATVHLAEPAAGGAPLVLKVLRRGLCANDAYLERFIREYAVISRIDSRHVVRIHDQGISDEHAFIAMEYLPDGDLKERMEAGLPLADAVRYFCQLLLALRAIHEAGVIHRDLKPRNLMLRDPQTLVVADFGIARDLLAGGDFTATGTVLGTPSYMSPEQGLGEPLDSRSDLYSAGILFHEMLTGTVPFTGESIPAVLFQHCHAQPAPLPPRLSRFQPLMAKLLAKRREDRPADAASVLDGLEL